MAGSVQIFGIGDLSRKFAELAENMKQKTARRMVATAGGIVRKEAKALALSQGLKQTGTLVRNIAIKREKNVPEGVEQYHLGVRHGRELRRAKIDKLFLVKNKSGRVVWKRRDDPFYWRFLEFGTKHINPYRFINQALINKRQEAIDAMLKRLERDLERSGA